MKESERRGNRIIIERDFQLKFTLRICLVGGLLLIGFGGLALYLLKLNYDMLAENALIQMPTMVSNIRHEQQLLSFLLMGTFALMIGILFGLGLLLTHRIVGPLVNLQRRLKEFGDGKRGVRLRIRKEDDFKNVETIFNYAMESADERERVIHQTLSAAVASLKSQDLIAAESELTKAIGLTATSFPRP